MKQVYLDNQSNTRIDDNVLEVMLPYLKQNYGNPQSIYSLGQVSKDAIEKARSSVAKLINCKPEEIICENCRISERNKMRRKIRRLFYKNPCIKFHDVLNQVKKNFSHISEEISLGVVSTERNFLIKSLAGKIFFDDFNSETLKTLVMIYKQLPKEKLTDAVIKKSVKELRFNFLPAENKKFEQK